MQQISRSYERSVRWTVWHKMRIVERIKKPAAQFHNYLTSGTLEHGSIDNVLRAIFQFEVVFSGSV